MKRHLTDTQRAALRYYGHGTGRAPAVSTTRSLSRLGLIQERQATDTEKAAIGRPSDQPWRITELTPAGQSVASMHADQAPR